MQEIQRVIRISWIVTLSLALIFIITGSLFVKAQQLEAKQTFMVRMRDGVRLATDVYLPEGPGPFPAILIRTPYNKDALSGLGLEGKKRGYAIVIQDTRGRFASEGANLPFETDARDGYDTLEWLTKQPWCNGKIGTFGGSALGITQLLLASTGTHRITAQHITVGAPSLYFDATYPGGEFRKSMIEDWLRITKFHPDALNIWRNHPTYDAYWKGVDLENKYEKVDCPAVHIGGWFDIFAQGTINAFLGYQTKGGPNARGKQKLIIGPWTHAVFQDKAGELTFPNAKNPPTNYGDAWRWFDHYLKGVDNGVDKEPAVTYYVMGDVTDPDAPGNEWRTANTWPPVKAEPTPLYLQPDKKLSWEKPTKSGKLVYTYDPKNPVPTIGGYQLTIPAGPMDQRKIEERPDVLVFTSAPLNKPLEVTGKVKVILWVSSDTPDTDFVARLCDVYPDGRSYNICEGIIRACFREGFTQPKWLKPGQIYRLEIDLWSTSIIFNKGHRIRLHITSSSYPGFESNPNTAKLVYNPSDAKIAHNTIHIDAQHPSYILLPVVKKK
ncbi:CocE/NonD family hydrolase [bacterium]|nr:CocE/NonD family hydrolase [bacterium]